VENRERSATTWQPVFEQGPSTAIGDVTIAPSNPDIVWIGTGEANIFRSSQAGAGVYKSTDAGKTWQQMGSTGTYTTPAHRSSIRPTPTWCLLRRPVTSGRTTRSVACTRTADGGKTWEKVLFVRRQDRRDSRLSPSILPTPKPRCNASTWQRIRLKWNDPRNFPDYARQRHLQVDGRGQDVGGPINKGLPEPKFRGRIGLDVCRSTPNVVYAFVDKLRKSRESRRRKRRPILRPALLRGSSRRDRLPLGRQGASWTQMSGPHARAEDVHGTATRTPTAGCSGRSGLTRTMPIRFTRWAQA